MNQTTCTYVEEKPLPVLLSAKDAEKLGLTRSAFYRLLHREDVPSVIIGGRKYPVILYVYGGPHVRLVKDNYIAGFDKWALILASKGYIVFIMDNRGTLHHGAEYEKAIHRQCGKAEMADQMEGMKWNTWNLKKSAAVLLRPGLILSPMVSVTVKMATSL